MGQINLDEGSTVVLVQNLIQQHLKSSNDFLDGICVFAVNHSSLALISALYVCILLYSVLSYELRVFLIPISEIT